MKKKEEQNPNPSQILFPAFRVPAAFPCSLCKGDRLLKRSQSNDRTKTDAQGSKEDTQASSLSSGTNARKNAPLSICPSPMERPPNPWRRDRTSPVVWLLAILCAVLAVSVIIAGIVVFAIYMAYEPRVPYMQLTRARLNKLDYDQSGLLGLEIDLTVVAENDNKKAAAGFSDLAFVLRFHGIRVAELRADPFEVPKNSSFPLDYAIQSSAIPLDEAAMDEMDAALKQGKLSLGIAGQARTRWRVGVFLSVKFLLHLSCQIHFAPSNGSTLGALACSSKSH